MRRVILGLAALGLFATGFVAAPAVAQSYPTSWFTVFGNSTSCALGQASVNDSTFRAGARTQNRQGCSSSAAFRTVPTRYIGARAFLVNSANDVVCGDSGWSYNPSPGYSRTVTTGKPINQFCPYTGRYYGVSNNRRQSDAGSVYTIAIQTVSRLFVT